MLGKSHHSLVVGILLAGLLLRLVYSFVLVSPEDFYAIDGHEYADLASNLYHGHGFSISSYRWFEPIPPDGADLHPEVYRPFLLPAMGALLHALPGSWELHARVLMALLGTLCALVAYLLSRSLFGDTPAVLTTALIAVYPYGIYYSAHWSTEIPFLLLLLVTLYSATRFRYNPTSFWSFFTGLAAGVACMARPNGLVVLAGISIWIPLVTNGRNRLQGLIVFLLGAALVLVPWTARNYHVSGVSTPTTAFGAYNFWLGNNHRVSQMYKAGGGSEFPGLLSALYEQDSRSRVHLLEARQLYKPKETGAFWTGEALDFITTNPGEAATIWLHRAAHYWRPWPNISMTGRPLFYLSILSVTPLLFLGLLGLVHCRKSPAVVVLLLIPPVLGMIGAIPFNFQQRLRFPFLDPFFLILASVALSRVLSNSGPRSWIKYRVPFRKP